jgi:hypothetical protein
MRREMSVDGMRCTMQAFSANVTALPDFSVSPFYQGLSGSIDAVAMP